MVKKITKVPSKKALTNSIPVKEYAKVLLDIKNKIRAAQLSASVAANQELIHLYWTIGGIIHEQQNIHGWGSSLINKLATDLQSDFPGMEGFSRSNIFRMRAFYLEYSMHFATTVAPIKSRTGGRLFTDNVDNRILSMIPWSHNIVLLEKIKTIEERLWYAHKALECGWSRNMLVMHIDARLYQRQGKAITNFSRTLVAPQSDLAQQSLKDPYLLDFLTLRETYVEKDVEQGLIDHIQKFLLELGDGFAFVGRQYPLEVRNKTFYIDLLFYHFKLQCFVVVELKTGEFEPRDAGQINFYLSAIDSQLRSPHDNPTLGLLLCKTKDNVVVEYALRRVSSPIGVAGYETTIVETLPKSLQGRLPSTEEIEATLEQRELLIEEQSGQIRPHLKKRISKKSNRSLKQKLDCLSYTLQKLASTRTKKRVRKVTKV